MTYYYDYLKSHGLKVKYIDYKQKLPKADLMFDPIDRLNLNIKIIDSPGFLLNNELLENYRTKTDKFFFNSFYMWSKAILRILPGIKSTDSQNRNKFDNSVKIPKIPSNNLDKKYMNAGIKLAKSFKGPGNVDNFRYPLTHTTAKLFLRKFIEDRLKNFGKYQDSILSPETPGSNTLFHSFLSSSINIGLITPIDIIKEILKVKSKVPINSVESFIRQLFWREYQRYCYKYGFELFKQNYFGNKNKLYTSKNHESNPWYSGTTGIEPVDNCIKEAFDTGYLHHIKRLMVIGNYMNLSGISPKEGYRWFMEFSCDSYDWVMHQNVLDMVFFVTGGKTMRRPYISSSAYILRMSDYKREKWADIWDKLYRNFIKKHRKKLHKHYPFYIFRKK
jgi:deoxyribodipyrimidine photolyase-related protein